MIPFNTSIRFRGVYKRAIAGYNNSYIIVTLSDYGIPLILCYTVSDWNYFLVHNYINDNTVCMLDINQNNEDVVMHFVVNNNNITVDKLILTKIHSTHNLMYL